MLARSVERAAEGVDAIFAMGTPFEAGIEAEIRQGITVAEAARGRGKYLVYNSVASAEPEHWHSPFREQMGGRAARRQDRGRSCHRCARLLHGKPLSLSEAATAEGFYATPLRADLKLSQFA